MSKNAKRTESGTKPRKQRARGQIKEKESRQTDFTADQKGQQKFDNQTRRQITQAVLPDMRPGSVKPRRERAPAKAPAGVMRKVVEQVRNPRRRLVTRLENYLRCLSDPFASEPVKCPINYNPVPSFMTSVARLTYNTEAVFASANSSTQLCFFPGHGFQSDADAMDGESYHARSLVVNATTYTVGPVQLTGLGSAFGTQSTGLTLGNAQRDLNTAASTPFGYDEQLPYFGAAGDGAHTRWKLVSMGVRLENTTLLANRAGDVVSVMPSSSVYYATQNLFGKFPTYSVSQAANTGTWEGAWIPRPTDLAFWHTVSVAEQAASTSVEGAGWYIFLNNNTAVTQTYRMSVVMHWEMAGTNLAAIASPSVLQPADKNTVEPTLDVMKFTAPSASGALGIARAIAEGSNPLTDGLSAFAAGAAKTFKNSLLEGAEGLLAL